MNPKEVELTASVGPIKDIEKLMIDIKELEKEKGKKVKQLKYVQLENEMIKEKLKILEAKTEAITNVRMQMKVFQ